MGGNLVKTMFLFIHFFFENANDTDYGVLTILAQDNVGGLEVLTRTGKWISAPPIPGTFVVNIGAYCTEPLASELLLFLSFFLSFPHVVLLQTFSLLSYTSQETCLRYGQVDCTRRLHIE